MEARAVARYVRMSPRKVRRVAGLIKGLPVREARALLEAMPHRAARVVRRALDSAAANAVNNQDMAREELWVSQVWVNAGPTLKRVRFASGGRMGLIRKRISHVSVVVSDEE